MGIVAIGAMVLIGGAVLLFGPGGESAPDVDVTSNADGVDDPTLDDPANPGGAGMPRFGDPVLPPATGGASRPTVGQTETFGPFEYQVPSLFTTATQKASLTDPPDANGDRVRIWQDRDPQTNRKLIFRVAYSDSNSPGSIGTTTDRQLSRALVELGVQDVASLRVSTSRYNDLMVARRSFTGTWDGVEVYGVLFCALLDSQNLTLLSLVNADPPAEDALILEMVGRTIRRAAAGATSPEVANTPPAVSTPSRPVRSVTSRGGQHAFPAAFGPTWKSDGRYTIADSGLGPFRIKRPVFLNLDTARSVDGDEVAFRQWVRTDSPIYQGTLLGMMVKRGSYNALSFPKQVDELSREAAGMLGLKNPEVYIPDDSRGQIAGLGVYKRGIVDDDTLPNGVPRRLNGFTLVSFVDDQAVVVAGITGYPPEHSLHQRLVQAAYSLEYDGDLSAGPASVAPSPSGPVAEVPANVDPRYAALLDVEETFGNFGIRIPLGMEPTNVRLPKGQTWSWQSAVPDGMCHFVVNVAAESDEISPLVDLSTMIQRELGQSGVRFDEMYANIAEQKGMEFKRVVYFVRSSRKASALFVFSGVHQGKRLFMAGLAPGVAASNPYYLLLESAARTARPLP